MMRWGVELSYVRPTFFAQAGWLGSNADWSGASDFSSDTDKTFQWIAAYADPSNPLEVGLYGSIGAFPLAEGGVDRYHTIAAYVERDPLDWTPGVFATYQAGYDSDPGMMTMNAMMGSTSPAKSRVFTLDVYEPFFGDRAMVGLRHEIVDSGLDPVASSNDVDLEFMPFAHYYYLHFYFEDAMQQNAGPVWRSTLWWAVPVGK